MKDNRQKTTKTAAPLLLAVSFLAVISFNLIPAFSSSQRSTLVSETVVLSFNSSPDANLKNQVQLGGALQAIRNPETTDTSAEKSSAVPPASTPVAPDTSTVVISQYIGDASAPPVAAGEVVVGDAVQIARS